MKKGDPLEIDDVVQLNPNIGKEFAGCFMIVTEIKCYGAKGYIPAPSQNADQIYLVASWENMEFIGKAHFSI